MEANLDDILRRFAWDRMDRVYADLLPTVTDQARPRAAAAA